ncbi:HEAT repeat-containing protein 5B [Danaus plexippus]|uniref:HEAT repeat-containing protein 5B n=1 Tax=Danaus plexippus TaxID=13037 RepID=UPI002AB32707|nr:HEAT repeat-containing protein 5B [Danaus plexippus]XP_061379698.1 HEAT repeat-containing protein 5B [Danaus plexippus]
MEVSHSLTLNEAALQQLPDDKKPHFIFEWLRFLDKVLVAAHKSDLKNCQQKLVAQLVNLFRENLGVPARRLLARCLATLFSVGDTFLLFETVNKCNDIIKVKDDSPSYLPTRLAAICCLGSMYEKLGRMMGRSYEETVTTLVRSMKSAESQTRLEIMITLDKICVGMGTAAGSALREVSRAARSSVQHERAPVVRAAAATALKHVLPLMRLTPADVDAIAAACLRAAQTADYALRCSVADLLGALVAATQAGETNSINTKTKIGMQSVHQNKKDPPKNVISLDEVLNLLMGAFLRGGTSFLKGEIIKSGSAVNREVRVCVTHAYVIFVQNMGGVWLERNLTTFLSHVLDLVANPKAASSHVDAVYSRKCINYILKNTLGKMLGEKAQASACREIIQIIAKQMNSIDFNPENAKDCNQETLFSQHLLVCALTQAGSLCLALGTALHNLVSDPGLHLIDTIFSVLEHPCVAARLAAASCARSLGRAHPALLTPLLDRCADALDVPRPTPHRISGYSAAYAAILGAVQWSPLGVPHGRGKVAFNAAEQLLRSAGQSSRLTAARTNAGWLIVGAICTLGVPVVRGLLPRMLLLWRNSFPRSAKELESEKARGDAFTWQVTLEGRAGALSALHSLLIHCPSLVNNEDTAKRLAQPIDGAIAVLTNVGQVVRNYGGSLKAPAALLRLRLYQACAALGSLSAPAAPLLRLLAAELAGSADPGGAIVATGMLRNAMHPRDTILLGEEAWIYETDHADIEEQLISPLSASGSGALEHDPCRLYRDASGAQPLGVAVIDASVALFPAVFARAANKHRQQMLEHFVECIKMSKGTRQEAIQINVYTALLLALRTLGELKSSLGQDAVKNTATELIIAGLSASSTSVRAAAASCAGRLCGCITESETQALSERVIALARTSPNRSVRAAAAAAVGTVQRARGAASSAAALPVLRALAQDTAAVEVQVWSLHALSVLIDASGPMFRSHVESTLNLVLKLLFSAPPSQDDLHRSIGRLLAALITVVGPELQSCGHSAVGRFTCACAALREGGGAGSAADAIGGLQQLHLFAPGHANLRTLVPQLCRDLSNPELSVRRAALCCLRQLSQKDAADVCKYALLAKDHVPTKPYCGVVITDTGLPGALFAFLDMERDEMAISYAKDTLTCCLLAAAANKSVKDWLLLAKRVLTVKLEDSNNPDTELEDDDDQAEFHAESEQATHPAVQPRWPTRVFAMECIQKVMGACEATGESAHFDLVKAKEKLQEDPNADYLSLHLSDLVRMSFVGATGESDALRLCGLNTLQLIIQQYARAPEPDFPGHLLLEQYQAQVGAAVRPAFAGDTASHVTAAACDVCSAWIGCGVARDINDLRRVHQLLVSSLDKLNKKGNTTLIYNESMATLEKLSILKAWAEVYIVAMVSNDSAPGSYVKQLDTKPVNNKAEIAKWRNRVHESNNQTDNTAQETEDDDYGEFESKGESLLKLVEPELESLGENWLAALKDHALLSLPPEFASQLPHGGGAFYSMETAEASRAHYGRAWPALLYAAALRYNADITTGVHTEKTDNKVDNRSSKTENGNFEFFEPADEKFHLLFGICMEALCAQRDMTVENTITVLLSLVTLLDAPENRARLMKDRALAIEVCQIIHRAGLTQESIEALLLCADVLELVITAAKDHLRAAIADKTAELAPDATPDSMPESVLEVVHTLGEGGPTGDLPPGKSLVFACLEVCLCLLVRRLPALSPLKQEGRVGVIGVRKGLGVHGDTLLIKSLASMSQLTTLTSPQGALSILPTILYLSTEVIRSLQSSPALCEAGVLLLQLAADCSTPVTSQVRQQHALLLRATLANILERVKTEDPEQRIDSVTGARAMAAIVARAEPDPPLHYPCINHFRQCLDTKDPEVFSSVCSILRLIWCRSCPPRSVSWWARSLAGRVVGFAAGARHAADAGEARAAVAAVGALDDLVDAAPDAARIQMLWILVPIVTSYLREPPELEKAPHLKILHDFALQWLMRVGPKHPQEFKSMLSQSPELRSKLEAAVKARAPPRVHTHTNRQQTPHAPTIQLRTDFSDFR